MPLTRFLDPRFKLVAALIDDPDETSEMRATARRHAEIIAAESDFTFDEALAAAGVELGAKATLENDGVALEPVAAADDGVGGVETSPTDGAPGEANEIGGQIGEALRADPSRSDRDIARECGASPTTVGKARATLGLDKAVRTVNRGGKSYDMAIGDRS